MMKYEVNRQKWSELNVFEQMGNIGSEVGRAIARYRSHDQDLWQEAVDRALDLFSATAEDMVAKRSPRLKEILRSRELFCSLFFDGRFKEDSQFVETYFMQFAIAARNRQV